MSQLTSRAHAAYKADGVTTASPGRLIVMLYDRLLIDLDRAETALNNHQSCHEHLLHADLGSGVPGGDGRCACERGLHALWREGHLS